MDSMRVYAVELANLLPDRFLFVQNTTFWFIRDETLMVMDMRSNAQEWNARTGIWQFLAPLCHEFGVKSIITVDDECLEEAGFRALLDAIRVSLSQSKDKVAVRGK